MILEKIPQIKSLNSTEKLLLVSELWSDLASRPNEIPVSKEIIQELDRRIKAYESNPSNVTTWEAAKEKILTRKK
jgi:putative addiction module component (TIGR02574 family)